MTNRSFFDGILPLIILYLLFRYVSQPAVAQVIELSDNRSEKHCASELQKARAVFDDNSLDRVRACFLNLGFFDLQLSQNGNDSLIVLPGERYRFGGIDLEPDSVETPLSVLQGEWYSSTMLESGINKWVDSLNDDGFLFSEIRILQIRPDSVLRQVSITLKLEKGVRIRSGTISFSGAEINDAAYLKKISGAMDSVLVTPQYLSSLRTSLLQSEVLDQVSKPVIRFPADASPEIYFKVQERRLNQFDGILGYVPDQAGNGQIVGEFDLSLWNALAQGNGIRVNFERLRPENTRLKGEVRQHWIGDLPVGLQLNGGFFQNDSSYQYRDLKLEGYYMARSGIRFLGSVGTANSVEGPNSIRSIEPDGSKRFAEIGFSLNSLDHQSMPRSGIKAELRFGLSRKSVAIDSISAFTQQYLAASGEWYTPLGQRHILAGRNELYLLNADRITDSDLIRFGGANSLRGYAEEQFTASVSVWSDVEYRYLTSSESYLFLFAAAGYFERPSLLTETDNQLVDSSFLQSAGFGISYRIRIGRLRFTYALSPQESFANGKIHLGIITEL